MIFNNKEASGSLSKVAIGKFSTNQGSEVLAYLERRSSLANADWIIVCYMNEQPSERGTAISIQEAIEILIAQGYRISKH